MKIALGTIEVSDDERRAIGWYYTGRRDHLAPRDQCRRFIVSNGYTAISDQQVSMNYKSEQ